MSETEFKDFDALAAHVLKLYDEGKYAEALDIAPRDAAQFPDRINTSRYYRACLAAQG